MKKRILRFWLKLFLKYSPSLPVRLKESEANARSEWLIHNYRNEWFNAYYASRYYGLLQNLAGGTEKDSEYYINIGRRLELLHLLGESKNAMDKADKKPKKE